MSKYSLIACSTFLSNFVLSKLPIRFHSQCYSAVRRKKAGAIEVRVILSWGLVCLFRCTSFPSCCSSGQAPVPSQAVGSPKGSPCSAQICSGSHPLQRVTAQSRFSCLPPWSRPSLQLAGLSTLSGLSCWDLAPLCSLPPLFLLLSGFPSWSLVYLLSLWLPTASWARSHYSLGVALLSQEAHTI